jgi:hypothetical protein
MILSIVLLLILVEWDDCERGKFLYIATALDVSGGVGADARHLSLRS